MGVHRWLPVDAQVRATAFHAVSFDAAACFAIRTDDGASPTFALHCLGGPRFALRAGRHSPIRSGEAFVSVRTVKESPFGDGNLYFGGYDCNFFPADGTAWVATSNLAAP